MKKLTICLFVFVMLFSSVALSEDYSLSENEQQFVGPWVMYMSGGEKTYLYTITFFDDLRVVLKTVTFSGSKVASDNTSTGKWTGFGTDMIFLTLSGNSFVGGLRKDGLFMLMDYETTNTSGYFARCPDLSYCFVSSEDN